ncbi:Uncharacterised protein [Enterobacter cancerogenus]|uniref:Uncharacterized protein n=1 Tax=Enterobacter cancerogenus TaxID=69218 RepID=A0A484ZCY9_9ENTR|nr:Uncharacterised protein [Enterobacter cancerogenus]
MVDVTHESLAARIAELEAGPRSLKEDFALQAYLMLLPYLVEREIEDSERKASCSHDWWVVAGRTSICLKCGERKLHG